jgi:hypothetical protein
MARDANSLHRTICGTSIEHCLTERRGREEQARPMSSFVADLSARGSGDEHNRADM